MPDRFDEFWKWVPRKVGRKICETVEYPKALREGATEDRIIAGAKCWWKASAGKDPQYIVHPRRWLKEGRFDDEPDKVVKPDEDAVWASKAATIRQPWGKNQYPRQDVEECYRRKLLTREEMEAKL